MSPIPTAAKLVGSVRLGGIVARTASWAGWSSWTSTPTAAWPSTRTSSSSGWTASASPGAIRLGLAAWMAGAHGAGLMLVPVLIPLCLAASPARELTASGALGTALAAVAVHTLAMLVVTGAIALVVYHWVGVAVLRRGWLNLDRLWTAALVATGLLLLMLAGT
jgi:hypothetical protein